MGEVALPVCENCGADTGTLTACPCGLACCRIVHGVCWRCHATIERNATERRRETRGAA